MQRSNSPRAIIYTTNNKSSSNIDDKIRQNQIQVDDLKITMKDNMVKVLDRGQKLEDLEQSANNLENQASMFQVTSKKVKKWALCKNRKWTLILIVVIIAIILIIALGIGLGVGLNKTNTNSG
jgi:vesicle-associated membrane protein 4